MPVGRRRTMALILSVIERKLWPAGAYFSSPAGGGGAGGSPAGRLASVAMSLCLQVRGGVAQGRQGPRARLGGHVGQQALIERRVLPRSDLTQRTRLPAVLVNVAEDNGLGRAGSLAGGQDLAVGDGPVGGLRVDLGAADALHAVGALLHDAARAHGHVGV